MTTETLGEALPREMARVRDEVLSVYLTIGPGAMLATAVIRFSLDNAAKALAEGDVMAMIAALQDLKGYEL